MSVNFSDNERLDHTAFDYNGIEYKILSAKGSEDVKINVKIPQFSSDKYKDICLKHLKEIYGETLQDIADEGWDATLTIDAKTCEKGTEIIFDIQNLLKLCF